MLLPWSRFTFDLMIRRPILIALVVVAPLLAGGTAHAQQGTAYVSRPACEQAGLLSIVDCNTAFRNARAEFDEPSATGIDPVDIGVLITQITDDLPSPDDVERVRERLAAQGWPLDDPRDGEDAP